MNQQVGGSLCLKHRPALVRTCVCERREREKEREDKKKMRAGVQSGVGNESVFLNDFPIALINTQRRKTCTKHYYYEEGMS